MPVSSGDAELSPVPAQHSHPMFPVACSLFLLNTQQLQEWGA